MIDLAISILEFNDFIGLRKVIDISGDGPNNVGGNVALARDSAFARGITINGLPILSGNPGGHLTLADLDVYYRDCLIGGPGAFVVVPQEFDPFAEAILRKLIMAATTAPPRPFLQPQKYVPQCDISERLRKQYIRRPPPLPGN